MKLLKLLHGCLVGGWIGILGIMAHNCSAQGYGRTEGKPKFGEGRVHLNDGTTQIGKVALVGHNQIKIKLSPPLGLKAAGKPAEKLYSALDVSSFVLKQDSFTVVKDFTVFRDGADQHYNSGFMRVCAAGAGVQLYEFTFMSEQEVQRLRSAGYSPAVGVPLLYTVEEQTFMMTKYLLLHRADKWLALPDGGRRLRDIIEPAIADDVPLTASIQWSGLTRGAVAGLVQRYIFDKTSPAKP